MTPGELARSAVRELEPNEPDSRSFACGRCARSFYVPGDLDPTPFCDECAHAVVEALAYAIVAPPTLEGARDAAIRAALASTGGNRSAAARVLGCTRYTVIRWCRARGLDVPPARRGRPGGRSEEA